MSEQTSHSNLGNEKADIKEGFEELDDLKREQEEWDKQYFNIEDEIYRAYEDDVAAFEADGWAGEDNQTLWWTKPVSEQVAEGARLSRAATRNQPVGPHWPSAYLIKGEVRPPEHYSRPNWCTWTVFECQNRKWVPIKALQYYNNKEHDVLKQHFQKEE